MVGWVGVGLAMGICLKWGGVGCGCGWSLHAQLECILLLSMGNHIRCYYTKGSSWLTMSFSVIPLNSVVFSFLLLHEMSVV